MEPISPKCYKAVGFDGSTDLIPSKFVFGRDFDVQKSDAWWIAEWILERKNLTFSRKKSATFSSDGKILPTVSIENHIPEKVEPVESNEIDSLEL